ncbi:hypothetical protein SAMN03097699_0179 [Flavobacteriaceae bacterium MAR_2010_188]|nr:hypothetical protein SAMN03097699_0179 [Flavobacteriaceae bacterium MAR_2010_188]
MSCAAVFSTADGTTDAFYLKFTTPKQKSLILGSSRAAQGIIPSVLNDKIENGAFFNYAFTIVQSAYGSVYLKSIRNKLDDNVKNSIHIVCVNPWVICTETTEKEDSIKFREVNSYLDKTRFVNMKPNFEYLVESFQSKNIDIVNNKSRKGDYQTFFVHDDGWLEVKIESDMISTKERTRKKYETYKKALLRNNGLSQIRLGYLYKTIKLLKESGKVYLVRMPISDDMLGLEQQLVPKFDSLMQKISGDFNVEYINAMPFRKDYEYTDGHHLTTDSAKRFSEYLAGEINNAKPL